MARINIEECWWTDPRRSKLIKLIGDENLADGVAIKMWRLAQEHWGRGRQRIPIEVFNHVEAASKLIEAGLALVEADSIYVRGSSQYLDWHHEKREAARKGGQKSAESRRNKLGSAQPKAQKTPKQTRSRLEADSKQFEPSGSGSLSDSGFGSSSGTDSGFEVTARPLTALPATTNLIAAYCDRWKARHGSNPPITGKDAGIVKRVAKGMSDDRFLKYLDAFFAMPDAYLLKAKHPVELFELKLKEIAAFAESGSFTTRRQVQQIDDMASNMILLDKVRKGEA